MNLKGGYIIDEIFNLFIEKRKIEEFDKAIEEFSKLCYFELVGIEIDLEKEMNEIILEIPSQFLGEEAQVVYLIVLSVAIFLILIIILCFKSKKKIRYLE